MTNVRGRDKKNIYTKTGKQHKKDKTSQISSYEHKQFFEKNITVHSGSHNDTVALPNGISSYINIQHK